MIYCTCTETIRYTNIRIITNRIPSAVQVPYQYYYLQYISTRCIYAYVYYTYQIYCGRRIKKFRVVVKARIVHYYDHHCTINYTLYHIQPFVPCNNPLTAHMSKNRGFRWMTEGRDLRVPHDIHSTCRQNTSYVLYIYLYRYTSPLINKYPHVYIHKIYIYIYIMPTPTYKYNCEMGISKGGRYRCIILAIPPPPPE